jgi:mono/diheme cytochrome c family protein
MKPFVLCCVIVASFLVLVSPLRSAEPTVDYNREIRPILAKNCFACHGPDDSHRAAKLRLDRRETALRPRKRGAAIVPGAPEKSLLIQRVRSDEESQRMPPVQTGNSLTPHQIATLQRWITQGAPYAEHWAFVPPKRPPLPAVQQRLWPRNGIDFFVLAELEKHGLKPAAEADRYTLLRRLSFDLRGLPPTPQELEQFLRDRSPYAYENAVDRFLADPAYGERWARLWLDLARYADSAGYGSDPLRPNIWPYRDWVIDAFNRNLPYDQFSLEQLAGDLLPNPTLPQRIATP